MGRTEEGETTRDLAQFELRQPSLWSWFVSCVTAGSRDAGFGRWRGTPLWAHGRFLSTAKDRILAEDGPISMRVATSFNSIAGSVRSRIMTERNGKVQDARDPRGVPWHSVDTSVLVDPDQ